MALVQEWLSGSVQIGWLGLGVVGWLGSGVVE